MRLGPAPEVAEAPGQFWKDFIRETAPVFRTPTIEQLESFIEPTFRALCDGAAYVDDRLREIFDELQPSLIVEDNVVCFPAIHASGHAWARIVSCNPLEIQDPGIPPVFSGYPANDRGGWDEFRAAYLRAHAALHAEFSELCVERGAPPLPEGAFIHASDQLNLYVYPEEIDYAREPAARAVVASPRLLRPRRRGDVRAAGAARRTRGEARLPLAREPRLGRRRPDAPARSRSSRALRIASSSPRGRSTTSSTWPTTCGARSSCRSPRSCRSSTSSSPTAATTRPPSAFMRGSRWSFCRSSGIRWTTRSGSRKPASASGSRRMPSQPEELLGGHRPARRRRVAPGPARDDGDPHPPSRRAYPGGRPDRAARTRRPRVDSGARPS